MGTRSLTCVAVDGKVRVAQFSAWDGYPTGEGMEIVRILLGGVVVLDRLKEQVRKVRVRAHCPDDTGAEVIATIYDAESPAVFSDDPSFAGDSLYCEWAYVLDLDNEMLEVYKGFNKAPLAATERFHYLTNDLPPDVEFYPVRLVKKIAICDLTASTMGDLEQDLNNSVE